MRKTLSSLVVSATLVAPTTAQNVESPLGRLVDIGGRRLHLHCTGTGHLQ